jgi:hypothetical protein
MFEMSEIERAFEEYLIEEGTPKNCEVCPFADKCDAEELYWGCSVWEDEMGDDL